jgi:ATP-dependent Lon protease
MIMRMLSCGRPPQGPDPGLAKAGSRTSFSATRFTGSGWNACRIRDSGHFGGSRGPDAQRARTERKILSLKGLLSSDVMSILDSIDDPGRLADLVSSNLRLKIDEAQKILEALDPIERLSLVNEYLDKEFKVSTMQAKIQSEAKEEMDRSQREYYLREQMRAIKRELGDIDDRAEEIAEFREKRPGPACPRNRKRRPQATGPPGADAPGRGRGHHDPTYLDWVVELPWSKSTRDGWTSSWQAGAG